ncbi:hypothetical protein [Streptomyces sp. NPDC001480]|uniref:hypothetical protein n=1 Tax=Streptomyces sp. NPDC001480 TaxID=3364577 RepID=UPI0036AF9643
MHRRPATVGEGVQRAAQTDLPVLRACALRGPKAPYQLFADVLAGCVVAGSGLMKSHSCGLPASPVRAKSKQPKTRLKALR